MFSNNKYTTVFILLAALFFWGTIVMAESSTAGGNPDLGRWWEKNSLAYDPVPDQWLFHIEGTLDFKHKRGNVESELYNGLASLMVRKQRFTNTLTYIIDRETKEQESLSGGAGKTDTDYRSFQESLRFDLTPRLYTEGGYVWEKDTANFISDRDSYYAGMGYTLAATAEHHLDLFVAGGYVEEEYPALVQLAMNTSGGHVWAGYLRQSYQWQITKNLRYKESFRIIQDFTESDVFNDDQTNLHVIDETHRYRWYLINEIYIDIVEHLAFMVGCKIDYDSNPWPTVKKRDITVKSGIQFSF